MNTERQQWYVLRDSRIQGPYTDNQLSRYMLLGRVRKNDRFSNDGQSWQSIDIVADLIPETLKHIDSEQGWQQYLSAKAAVDERGDQDDGGVYVTKDGEKRKRGTEDLSEFKKESGSNSSKILGLDHLQKANKPCRSRCSCCRLRLSAFSYC